MTTRPYAITAMALIAAAILLFWPEIIAFAQAGPLDSIAQRGNDTRDQLITVGKAFIGVVTVALFILAAAGKVPWVWVGMVVIAGAGLSAVPTIQSWLNQ